MLNLERPKGVYMKSSIQMFITLVCFIVLSGCGKTPVNHKTGSILETQKVSNVPESSNRSVITYSISEFGDDRDAISKAEKALEDLGLQFILQETGTYAWFNPSAQILAANKEQARTALMQYIQVTYLFLQKYGGIFKIEVDDRSADSYCLKEPFRQKLKNTSTLARKTLLLL
ncbi:MAG: hypothetical protein HYV97_01140 [Bdellovibrio sp.]|nr:hypothetical protein [Bdellovibrio sp.]